MPHDDITPIVDFDLPDSYIDDLLEDITRFRKQFPQLPLVEADLTRARLEARWWRALALKAIAYSVELRQRAAQR